MKKTITLQEKHLLIDFIFYPIDFMGLSVRAARCLNSSNIQTVWQILLSTDKELLTVKNMGKKTLEEIRRELNGPAVYSQETGTWKHFPLCDKEFCSLLRDKFEKTKTSDRYMNSEDGILVSRIWHWTTLPSCIDQTIHELYQVD